MTAVGRTRTVAVVGLEAVEITVEAHVGSGLPGFHVIGTSGTAARQAGDRVRTALSALGVSLGSRKVLVSLAPADVPKAGARFDLPMAMAILAQIGTVEGSGIHGCAFVGELALDGALRPVPGVLPSVFHLAALGIERVVVPEENAREATLVGGVEIVPATGLSEVVGILRGQQPVRLPPAPRPGDCPVPPELADVHGQYEARRALEVAAAGGHHLLLLGPPGCGKSMLAARLPGILPPLPQSHALELASIRSVAGLLAGPGAQVVDGLDTTPPLRAPHHSTSAPALLGGGSGIARPGEVSLAHRGCLFLDELFEWPRRLLDSLREPLEEGVVRVARSKATVTYPARFQLVCAANPCPCGGGDRCACADTAVLQYRSRLSGPLADRLDLAPAVTPLRAADLLSGAPGESSESVAARVRRAREQANGRWPGGVSNAEAPPALLRRTAQRPALRALAAAVDAGELSARGYDRALRVARTCADLAGSDSVRREDVLEAMSHRLALRSTADVARAFAPAAGAAP